MLKGLQGTLFGRSGTGGALLFTTDRPGDDLGGYASALYGNYDWARDSYRRQRATNAELGAKFNGQLGSVPFRSVPFRSASARTPLQLDQQTANAPPLR